MGKTLYDKIWQSHLVHEDKNFNIIYVDRQLIHEVTSPQAFEGLRINNRKVKNPNFHLAVADHNVPTTIANRGNGVEGVSDLIAKTQIQTLEGNCKEFKIKYFDLLLILTIFFFTILFLNSISILYRKLLFLICKS